MKFDTNAAKGLKYRKFWGLILSFVEVTVEKLIGGRGAFCSSILSRVKNKQKLIDTILEQNSKLIQAQNVLAQSNSGTSKTNDKSISRNTGNSTFRNDKNNESNVQKANRLEKLQVSFKDLHPEVHQSKVENKNIVVVGDSMIKNLNRRDVFRGDSVKFDLILGHQRRT